MTNRVRVYKVNEITQEFINSLEFSEPMLDKRSYFINNETEFYIQISVTFYTNFYKYSKYCLVLAVLYRLGVCVIQKVEGGSFLSWH